MAEIPNPAPNEDMPAAHHAVDDEIDHLASVLQSREHRVQELEATLTAAQATIEKLRHELSRYPSTDQQEAEIADAEHLEREYGVTFERMPMDSYPGRPYTTPHEIAAQKQTGYHKRSVQRVISNGLVHAAELAGRAVLYPSGVKELFTREQQQREDWNPRRHPGWRKDHHSTH